MHKKPHNPRHRPALSPPTPHAPVPSATPAKPETHWANVADWYDTLVGDDGSEFHREVIIPGTLRLLGLSQNSKPQTPSSKLAPLHILDLACGQGVLSRKLASLGHTLTALDAAAPLITAAKRRNESDRLPIHYAVADATKLLDETGAPIPPLKKNSFDAITLILAIQNITPLSPVWQACQTLLKPNAPLIIVMMHPSFRVPQHSDWVWNPQTGEQARAITQYLSSVKIDIQTHPGKAAHGKDATSTPHFHRPLQAYINTLGNAGLLLDHLEEWPSHKSSQAGPKKAALDRARKEIPMFLALRLRNAGIAAAS